MSQKRRLKEKVTDGQMLGGWVPQSLVDAVETWVARDPERTRAQFVRKAAKKLLESENIRAGHISLRLLLCLFGVSLGLGGCLFLSGATLAVVLVSGALLLLTYLTLHSLQNGGRL
jgi:hypothetical protein